MSRAVAGSLLLVLLLVACGSRADAGAPAAAAPAAAAPAANAKLVTVALPRSARGGARLVVRVQRRLDGATVVVNGRALRTPLLRRARQRTVIQLGATHGLRFGANRVVVRATGFDGGRQIVRRTVRIGRGSPLVGARVRGSALQGTPIQLDAGATRSQRGRPVYRWRVVAGPRRASARLRGAATARPRLVASHPGRHQLPLTAPERGRPARTAATT
ncbi:hypothetical protein VSS74_26330, partial [Conexibacter stalactiti]